MTSSHRVYVESGRRRVFAAAVDWPGWCRSTRDEAGALVSLVDHARRYRAALGPAAEGLEPPGDPSELEVVERLEGDATTDFGAPGAVPAGDRRPIDDAELGRLAVLLEASWTAFDRAAAAATGHELRTGPRGGGRELEAIVRHVLEADRAYVSRLGGRHREQADTAVERHMSGVRRALLDALWARAHGEPLPASRRSRKTWPPRYGVRPVGLARPRPRLGDRGPGGALDRLTSAPAPAASLGHGQGHAGARGEPGPRRGILGQDGVLAG
ncbi:MAG: hypothetical protein HY658_10685 [Actinobacteria bacterium]|nr:hypothetical protein [Actinomycetota bacterium]